MDNYKGIELHLHYILQTEGVHQMDAKVHNECEKQFLLALDALKAYTGDFHVEVKVPKSCFANIDANDKPDIREVWHEFYGSGVQITYGELPWGWAPKP